MGYALTCNVSQETHEAVHAAAKARGMKTSELIREALMKHLDLPGEFINRTSYGSTPNYHLHVSQEAHAKIANEAKKRNIEPQHLALLLIETIAKSNLFDAVIDDKPDPMIGRAA